MQKTRNTLLSQWLAFIALAVAIIVVFETSMLEQGSMAGDHPSRYIVTYVMELLTIALIPLALRLFKFRKVKAFLAQKRYQALSVWGSLRIWLLGLPLLANVILYYTTADLSFAYLAIIVFLCMFFILPTKGKCAAEVEGAKEEKK